MSKHFKPGPKAAVRPSRIRREPVGVPTEAELKAAEDSKREREKWWTFGGLAFYAAGIAALAVAVGAVTYSKYDPTAAAAEAARFRQCYNAGAGTNCVLDGDTVRLGQRWVDIAGIEAPKIRGASCDDEKTKGIDAAVRLATLLNGGAVTVSDPFLDQFGRTVGNVEVDGKDVGRKMIAAGAARIAISDKRDWCTKPAESSDAGE